jgi:lycopene cyclase domain-containing protein
VTYTDAGCLGVAFAVLLDLAVLRTNLLRRKAFWASYVIVLAFQLLVNGILTGRRLVVYSPAAILGGATPHLLGHWRVAEAPVEDLLFGFSLVLQTLSWWVWWGRRDQARARRARSRAGSATVTRRPADTATRRSSTR